MLIKKLDKTTVVSPDVANYYVDCVNGNNGNTGKDAGHPFKTIEQAVSVIKGRTVGNCVYNIKIIGDYISASQIEFDSIAHKINVVSNDDSNKSNIIVGEKITNYTQSGGVVSFTTDNYPSSVIINGHVIEMNKSCDLHYPTEIYKPEEGITLVQGSSDDHLENGKLYLKIKEPSGLDIELSGSEVFMYYTEWRTFSSTIKYYDEVHGYYYVECPSKEREGERVPYWDNFSVSDITFRILNNEDFDEGYYFTESGNTYTVHVLFDGTVNSIAIPTTFENVKIKNCFGLNISKVKFTGSNFRTINTYQAGANTYGAIMVEGSADISISTCEFEGTYGYSIMISNNCKGCHIENNYFHDLFGGAVHVSSANQSLRHDDAKEYTYETSGNDEAIKPRNTYIKNNLIKGFGRIDSNCCGVLVRFSMDNYIEHNTICDGFYSGISSGYIWKYGNDSTKHNHIAHNLIHHCLQFVTSDGGGIYLLGQQKGTIVEYNKIHDICGKAGKNNIMGIYFDQGTSDIIVRYNLVYGCRVNISIHYGRCIKLFNNLSAYSLGFNIGCNNSYYDIQYYNFLTLLNNMLIDDADQGIIAVGDSLIYVNTITNSPDYNLKLAESRNLSFIDTPPFNNIGNGDFSWNNPQPEENKRPKFFSNTMEGVYKFYIGFLSEEVGVTDTYLRSIEPITDRYIFDGTSENYDNYYRKLAMSLLHMTNTYLLSVADDPE